MKQYQKRFLKLTARQILLSLIDVSETLLQIFDKHRIYRKYYFEYEKWRENDKEKFYRDLYYLKQQKLIEIYQDKKGKYLELTVKGRQKIAQIQIHNLKIKKPKVWDQKWRIVIFDIPNTMKNAREAFRDTLKRLGFYHVQKSVFVYPYECYQEIIFLKEIYGIKPFVQYIIADRIETEIPLIKIFFKDQVFK